MSWLRGTGFSWKKDVRDGGFLGFSGKYEMTPIKSAEHNPKPAINTNIINLWRQVGLFLMFFVVP